MLRNDSFSHANNMGEDDSEHDMQDNSEDEDLPLNRSHISKNNKEKGIEEYDPDGR